MSSHWAPDSWRRFDVRQQPVYPDPSALDAATRELAAYPPLVSSDETATLERSLAEAQAGRAFLLQGGDCAESFAEFSSENIRAFFDLMAGMATKVAQETDLPIVRVARLAGQFAKPRSTDPEGKNGLSLPAYRGDIINGIAFEPAVRTPDPDRMFRAYSQSAATRAHLAELGEEAGTRIYTSHEALLLPYEEALVRRAGSDAWYGSSAHFLWIGDRTRFNGSAHVEFLRGLSNPIGIKCGPGLNGPTLLRLLDTLNPDRKAGRITLISRMGHEPVKRLLPPLLRAVRNEGHPVLWSCDPMHGNTIKATTGYKTRPLDRIFSEVESFFAICRSEGMLGGGIHIEMTGRDVTECTGGVEPVREQDLGDRYHTHCDPRLNPAQARELAALLSATLINGKDGTSPGARAA